MNMPLKCNLVTGKSTDGTIVTFTFSIIKSNPDSYNLGGKVELLV